MSTKSVEGRVQPKKKKKDIFFYQIESIEPLHIVMLLGKSEFLLLIVFYKLR